VPAVAIPLVEIYTKINKTPQMMEQYYSSKMIYIDEFWRSYDRHPPSVDSKIIQKDFLRWLPTFYDEVIILLTAEVS
jgi:hypothetical protein